MACRFIVTSPGASEGVRAATCRIDYSDEDGKLYKDVYPCVIGNDNYLGKWYAVLNDEIANGEPLESDLHHPFDVFVEAMHRRQDDLAAVDEAHGKDRYYKPIEDAPSKVLEEAEKLITP